MKLAISLVFGVALVTGIWGLSTWAGTGKSGGCCGGMADCKVPGATTAPSTQPTTQSATYICPMDSDVVSDKPGKCPKCGMNLVKK